MAAPDERRLVSVLMADLVGYTALAEAADPEQVKRLVDDCFERVLGDVTTFGGRLDKIVGDEVVAVFGTPVTHEDDAERAVRAALRMQETVAAVSRELEVPVQMRIGVNTGEVLVGAMRAGGDATVTGDVVNTAQRLETLAGPGEVVVGPATHAATRDAIEYETLGSLPVKGREEPVAAFRAIRALAPPGRRRQRGPTPFVGRTEELDALRHLLGMALRRRRAQFVLLVGDAGVGKSRLASEVASHARDALGARVRHRRTDRRRDARARRDRERRGGTYHDRVVAHWAEACARFRSGDGDARAPVEAAHAIATGTDAPLEHAIGAHVRALVLEALGTDDAAAVRADADRQLAELGIVGDGWSRLFAVALARDGG